MLLQPTSKKKKEQERSQVLIDKLQEEKKRQEDNNQLVMSWLKQEKDTFFNSRKEFILTPYKLHTYLKRLA